MARDGLDADEAGARIRAQMPLARKAALADYLIENEGPWHQTRAQVSAVHEQLLADAHLVQLGQPLPPRR